MNVVALQLEIAWEQKPANFQKVQRLFEMASPEKNSVVVLPEMFASGFSMNTELIAENYGGETEQFLGRIASKFGVYVIAGAAMRGRDGRCRNKALVFSHSGELLAFYAKMRPFTPGGEAQHYVAGDKPTVFRQGDWTICPFVCYDLRFPELFRQTAAAHRPELFAVIANWPEKRIAHWRTLLQARAIENQAYVIGVNRVGRDPFYNYNGCSLIVDPHGTILAEARNEEGWISAQLDLAMLRQYRQGLPFLQDLKLD